MDENSQVESVVSEQTPLMTSKKNTRLFLLGGLGIAILLIIIFSSYYFWLSSNKKTSYVYDAYNRYVEGNYEKSEALAKEGLVKYPDDPTLIRIALDSSSSIANTKGQEKETFEKNKALIEKAIKIGSSDPDIMLAVGYAYETAGKYEEALSYYQKAIQLKPTGDAYFHKGHVLAFLDQKIESKEAYDESYRLDPKSPQILMIKGEEFDQERKIDDAIEYYLLAAKSNRTTLKLRSEAFTAASMSEIGRNDKKKALEYSQAAAKIDPTSSHALGMYGFMLTYSLDTYKTGIDTLTKAIKQNPRIALNYMLIGVSLRANKNYPEAIALQKEAIIRVPDDNTLVGQQLKDAKKAKMYYELAQTYSLVKDVPNTISSLAEAISLNFAYKTVLRNDIQIGYFKFVADDPKFVTLLNS